jgi:hypothetical protein
MFAMSVAEGEIHVKSVWDASFEPAEQDALKAEDSEAWRGVTGLLLFLVSGGVLLASLAVLLICVMSL